MNRWVAAIWRVSVGSRIYRLIARLLPYGIWISSLLLVAGLVGGLGLAPPEATQGECFRILYVHVPCALWSLCFYAALGVLGAIWLIWRIRLAGWLAESIAPVGWLFTTLTLCTGSIWGRPAWGTWWIWDPRLTSELILWMFYCGYLLLQSAFAGAPDRRRTVLSVLALVGCLDLPVIHYSVLWWNTLHQAPTQWTDPAVAHLQMAWPLACMCLGLGGLGGVLVAMGLRQRIVMAEAHKRWVRALRLGSRTEGLDGTPHPDL